MFNSSVKARGMLRDSYQAYATWKKSKNESVKNSVYLC
jgi:hypothetical protein